MDSQELRRRYLALVDENKALKAENEKLKIKLGLTDVPSADSMQKIGSNGSSIVTQKAEPSASEKIALFMSLFKGRENVYARRWQNREGRSGYSPVCINEWKSGLCRKPAVKCSACPNPSYAPLSETIIEDHLRGNVTIGVYPLLQDETCHFLAIDFDGDGWHKDVAAIRETCAAFGIPLAVERSRSGNGGHAWFFFDGAISAALARRFGAALLTASMSKRHEISFRSYDRFFPNQDTLPKGGFANLIALPLQRKAREQGYSVFIDDRLKPLEDQWGFLAQCPRLSEGAISTFLSRLCVGSELGVLKKHDEESGMPEKSNRAALVQSDFPNELIITKSNMLYIPKGGISQRALNALKRLAAFKNPAFYKAQAMRMPTYNKPRIIWCGDETAAYMCLPRGCEEDIAGMLGDLGIAVRWQDKTCSGRPVNVAFTGELREDQRKAAAKLLECGNGVLSASTAFGKTVIAAYLIAERKVNTLILVHRQQLLKQWKDRMGTFLTIDEALPEPEKRRGRKKRQDPIGLIGAGRRSASGIIDIAVMQSLFKEGDVKEDVKHYGMVIVDECHHVSAFSFEQVLKTVQARYVYGLTATPTRADGHHPIIFMQCGPVRYKVDDKQEAEKRPFAHCIIPRFTRHRLPPAGDGKEPSIQEVYAGLVTDELRNQMIIEDVVANYRAGRNGLILTERTAHVELLLRKIQETIPDVIALVGGASAREKRNALNKIACVPADAQLTLVATGKYIGEGFDESRLDTLFLALPIAWKGTLQQYAGRLHRLHENKQEVQIYDYVDIDVRTLEKMYQKRLSGYAAIGYKTKATALDNESVGVIFDNRNFLPVFSNDVSTATREIVIVSPFVTGRRAQQMLNVLSSALANRVQVSLVTRPAQDYKGATAMETVFAVLKETGINLICKSNIHQKFAILDRRVVWYGSINLFSFGRSEESMMRLDNLVIADELLRSVDL